MGANNNERTSFVIPVEVGSNVSASTIVRPGIYFRKHSRIKNVWFVDQAGIALNAGVHAVITLQDLSANPFAAVDTANSAAVANTPLPLIPTTPVGDTANQPEIDVPAGTMLNVKVVTASTAVTTLAKLLIEWYPL